MLTTKDVSKLSTLETKVITPEQVSNLARNGAFPGAQKNETGQWEIPLEDVVAFFQVQKRKKKRFAWITAGSIVTIITVLTLISIAKDGLDLVSTYIFPKPTPTFPHCIVTLPSWIDCLAVTNKPTPRFKLDRLDKNDILACLPDGTDIEVIGANTGGTSIFYQISSSYNELGIYGETGIGGYVEASEGWYPEANVSCPVLPVSIQPEDK